MSTLSEIGRGGLFSDVDELMSLRPAALADRWRIYRRLRDESPVYRYGHQQLLSTYRLCSEVLQNNTLFENGFDPDSAHVRGVMQTLDRSQQEQYRAILEHQLRWLTSSNGEKHRRLRGLAARVFSPRAIDEMRQRIQLEIDHRLDELATRGQIEIIHDFAYQLPLTIISEMLDIPEDVRESIHRAWISMTQLVGNPPQRIPAIVAEAHQGMVELESSLQRVMNLRRGGQTTDLLARLLSAQEDEGGAITEKDIIGIVTQMVIAGHQTTQDTIGNGLLELLTNRREWEALCADPGLAANAVEEILRFYTPGQMVSRIPNIDFVLDGHALQAGSTVTCLLGAANRDSTVFADGDRFDIRRANARQHLAFSKGVHFCLGAALSRMEVTCFLSTFARRFPDAQLTSGPHEWLPNTFLLGVRALPIRLGRDRG